MADQVDAVQADTTIWEALDQWGGGLADWQRFILAHAVRDGVLSDARIGEAYRLFLRDLGLADTNEPLPEVPPSITGRPEQGTASPLRLVKVGNFVNINAIPSTSEMTFGDGLTIIYGGTGAGKTGFARLMSSACFSRSRPTILPNIYADDVDVDQAADIVLQEGNRAEETIRFSPDAEHSTLRRVAVFDAHVARVHLTEQNPLGFQPAGFDVFPEMTRVIGAISERLDADIAARNHENTFTNSFLDDGPIKQQIATLGADTNIDALRVLAVFGPDEHARATEVNRQLLELQRTSPDATLAALSAAKADIAALNTRIESLIAALNAQACQSYQEQLNDMRGKIAQSVAAASKAFAGSQLARMGTADWVDFVKASRTLGQAEKAEYPAIGDPCLLCHRPLDEPSASLIRRFWGFLDDESRAATEAANAVVDATVTTLRGLDIKLLPEESRVRSHIERLAPQLATTLNALSEDLTQRRDKIVDVLSTGEGTQPVSDPVDPAEAISSLVAQIDADETHLKQDDPAVAIRALEGEHILLRHRQVLGQLIDGIADFVADKKWVANAERQKRQALNTRFATDKERDLFRILIEGRYRNRLQTECEYLECNLPVEFQARGRAGHTVRVLSIGGGYKPPDVLSDGEQRAVALADFLTEVNLNPASAGIVLDDPVTSVDHERKRLISRRLVAEAQARQVVVFTHDLGFLSYLIEDAEAQGIQPTTHWVERDGDNNPGQVTLNDSPAITNAYRTTQKAKETLAKARTFSGRERVDAIRQGIGELRRTLEEIVIRHLLKSVVKRWDEQIRVGNLKKITWSDAIADEICTLNEELSRHIQGHSHSDAQASQMPDLQTLERLIARVDTVIETARQERPQQ